MHEITGGYQLGSMGEHCKLLEREVLLVVNITSQNHMEFCSILYQVGMHELYICMFQYYLFISGSMTFYTHNP